MASPWTLRAAGPARGAIDAGEIRRALAVLADPAAGVHVQGIPSGRSATVGGADADELIRAAHELGGGQQVYFTVNPVPAGLNRAPRKGDVLYRRWLWLDVDAAKPDGVNASEVEHEAAHALATVVWEYLLGEWGIGPVLIDSGNGWHLGYRIDLPADELTRVLLKGCLRRLGERFGEDRRGIFDRGVYPATIKTKLPGTWVRKFPEQDDRPWRMARLAHVPDPIRIVSVEALKALAGVYGEAPPPRPAPPPRDPARLRATAGRDAAYLKTALERQIRRVLAAGPGERERTLTSAAYNLGRWVPAGLDRAEAEARLVEAGLACGLGQDPAVGERGVRERIARRLTAGAEEAPRQVPEPSQNGHHAAEADAPLPTGALTVTAASITPQRVEWLWPARIPKRFITVLAGRTGLGKSFVMLDMVARISVGGEVPFGGGECFAQGGALIVSEDPPEYMLVPRLMEAGADLNRIRFMTWEAMGHYTIADVSYLDRAVCEVPNCRVVVIDPPTNFLGETDEHRNAEVRQMLMRLVLWVKDRDLACVLIMHVNKSTGKGIEAVNRVLGSIAWVSTARIAHSFAPDPDSRERALFVPMKTNLGKLPQGLRYEITAAAENSDRARVEWIGTVDLSADEAMGYEPSKPRRVVASEWLTERFREKRSWRSDELFAAGKAAGVSRNAIFEAKQVLDLPKARKATLENGDEVYTWWVPDDWQKLVSQEVKNQTGHLGHQDTSDVTEF